ncbi:MAG: Protein translocase subunit SecF [Candidatus Uhrbacteria bacterium GW2011_GWD2_41_121]|uniref:Protein-export membrane protein SecF n=1 Tax=Candidatus Uhrbacteria bacterium GW2011_GWC1_41_20 TaxID=1618983 RepID=A0A0G0VEG1_9BACT|nr:MAG: Protein translocase subunit SecF [Candidatus Uhrbacteria bacterium GW2011_GWE1_39_46]KKR63962.1 MAG: Protein translocase subunit SecF [Candidatus Uhrbacteria bacterium GW2011_GWC2_40_450]KKR90221.1 MAG: Protein translocase subunit SecF [Candidatus Uhrbacteria bacterium GW2011_GWD2_41_121]KKR90268.1 MAG: Protein translocase subunit SecF [Candidatus Uhrbacteria bacterium GW2011_GWE2_41_1153]KKR95535.1 MAG: Protein translocase subunit SecF [Candidatus Uhrbacteria bacterium GW2011_GWD1_41_1
MKYFDVIGKSKIWLSISGVLLLASLISIITFGLNPGIDFTGGSLMDVTFTDSVQIDQVRTVFSNAGFTPTVQQTGDSSYLIRSESLSSDQHAQILESLETNLGLFEENRYETIGSVIGSELMQASVKAIIILLVLIVLYVAWAFRKVSDPIKSWKYGLLTIVAAVHDVLIPLGVFAILGHYYGYEMNTAFIAALLTIIGYSINDTIVIFDRTRENLVSNRYGSRSFKDTVNMSIVQSFSRSINTSLTTVLVLVAIFLFGGETTRPFVLALIVGIIAGTYSSIFVASPLLVIWEQWKRNREAE